MPDHRCEGNLTRYPDIQCSSNATFFVCTVDRTKRELSCALHLAQVIRGMTFNTGHLRVEVYSLTDTSIAESGGVT